MFEKKASGLDHLLQNYQPEVSFLNRHMKLQDGTTP